MYTGKLFCLFPSYYKSVVVSPKARSGRCNGSRSILQSQFVCMPRCDDVMGSRETAAERVGKLHQPESQVQKNASSVMEDLDEEAFQLTRRNDRLGEERREVERGPAALKPVQAAILPSEMVPRMIENPREAALRICTEVSEMVKNPIMAGKTMDFTIFWDPPCNFCPGYATTILRPDS